MGVYEQYKQKTRDITYGFPGPMGVAPSQSRSLIRSESTKGNQVMFKALLTPRVR